MAISKYGTKLLKWLERYNITADELLARIPLTKQRGLIIKTALSELAPLELPASASFTNTSLKDTTLTLNWTAVVSATGYVVQRATNKAFTSNKTDIYTGNLLTFNDTGLTPGKTYYYRVYATAAGDFTDAEPNNNASQTIDTLPLIAQPATFVSSAIATTTATLTWAAVTGATGYILGRSLTADFASSTNVYTGNLLTYTNTGLTASTKYYYRITATDASHNATNYKVINLTTTA